jgi:hypothetical protein
MVGESLQSLDESYERLIGQQSVLFFQFSVTYVIGDGGIVETLRLDRTVGDEAVSARGCGGLIQKVF